VQIALAANKFVSIQQALRQFRELAGSVGDAPVRMSLDNQGQLQMQPPRQARRVTDLRTWTEAYANVLEGKLVFARSLPPAEALDVMTRELAFFRKATLQFGLYHDAHVISWGEAHRSACHENGSDISVLTSMHELRSAARRTDVTSAAAASTAAASNSGSTSISIRAGASADSSRKHERRGRSRSKEPHRPSAPSTGFCNRYNCSTCSLGSACKFKHACCVPGCGQPHPSIQHK